MEGLKLWNTVHWTGASCLYLFVCFCFIDFCYYLIVLHEHKDVDLVLLARISVEEDSR